MASVTDKQWQKWARENPYYGVLGVETAAVSEAETKERFFDTGEEDLGRAIADVERHFGPITRDTGLDFGCGVGRLLRAMQGQFKTSWGVDVAEEMLEMARENCATGKGEIQLANSVAKVAAAGTKFDFVHSYIVLQHIRPVQGIPIITQLVSLLKPGGCFALHFTIGDNRVKIRRMNWLRYRIKPLHWAYNVRTGRPWNEAVTEMNRYNMADVIDALSPLCDGDFAMRYLDQKGPIGVVLMGRRK
jgi:2-polyprenyl-3-methyl-5-hydroxy-6-metoxy-1,4-benzoquinol methylase